MSEDKDMYKEVVSILTTSEVMVVTSYYSAIICLNSYLFSLLMDELSWNIQADISWFILFSDDILVDVSKVGGVV